MNIIENKGWRISRGSILGIIIQLTFTCSKSVVQAVEKGVKYVQN